eukprot:Gb_06398 [translate_table: standard]
MLQNPLGPYTKEYVQSSRLKLGKDLELVQARLIHSFGKHVHIFSSGYMGLLSSDLARIVCAGTQWGSRQIINRPLVLRGTLKFDLHPLEQSQSLDVDSHGLDVVYRQSIKNVYGCVFLWIGHINMRRPSEDSVQERDGQHKKAIGHSVCRTLIGQAVGM